MNDTICKCNKEVKGTTNAIVSKTDNNISKDSECNDENYAFEMSEDKEMELRGTDNMESQKETDKGFNKGEIEITSVLECGEVECLQGVKINLYKINGLSPTLVMSKITDEEGKVVFSEIEEGCYRIIEIIDKKYFEKPKYINWNEIIIDSTNKKQKIMIINKIKRFAAQNKHITHRNE